MALEMLQAVKSNAPVTAYSLPLLLSLLKFGHYHQCVPKSLMNRGITNVMVKQ